jgi:hypothetical protein
MNSREGFKSGFASGRRAQSEKDSCWKAANFNSLPQLNLGFVRKKAARV